MKKLILLLTIILISAGCTESTKQVPVNKHGIKFSGDPWIQRVYSRCVKEMSEDCHPEKGMTLYQVKELRTLETGNCVIKLDWKHSDGYEQWSERIFHLRIARIYTFRHGRLEEWVDIPQ